MSDEFWIDSIGRQAVSSGGPYEIASTEQWNQRQFILDASLLWESTRDWRPVLSAEGQYAGHDALGVLFVRGTGTGISVGPSLTRLVCHALVNALPEPALDEAVDSLQDVLHPYVAARLQTSHRAAPELASVRARLRDREAAPGITVSE